MTRKAGSQLQAPMSDESAGGCVGGTYRSVHRDGISLRKAIAGPPGRNYWGRRLSTSSACHHLCVSPTGPVLRDGLGSLVVSPCVMWTVYEMACFQRGELLRQPPPSFTSLRRRYLPSSRRPLSRTGLLSFFGSRRGATCDVNACLTQGCSCIINASRRCGVPLNRLLRHRSVQVVGTCCTRPHRQGHLCQVRAARHCSLPDSVLELLADDPPCLGVKKQRVVKVVMDAWLTTAGLRGGQVLEASSRIFLVSHTLLPSASAGPQGPVHRDGLGSLVPVTPVSGGIKKYLSIFSSLHRVSFHPLDTQAAAGCCGTGPFKLSGPVALGPGVRALVSGRSCSPPFPPGRCALSSSPTILRIWGSRSRGSLRSRWVRDWRPPDSGADKYWRRVHVPRRQPHSRPLCLRCSPGFRTS